MHSAKIASYTSAFSLSPVFSVSEACPGGTYSEQSKVVHRSDVDHQLNQQLII